MLWKVLATHVATISLEYQVSLPFYIHVKLWASITTLGVAVACAIKAALEKHNISGKIELLGTPGNPFSHQLVHAFSAHISVAEEGGSGKVALLEKGAYKDMDACLMYVWIQFILISLVVITDRMLRCHPAPGPIGSVSLSSCLALQRLIVEYKGHT